MIMQDNGPQSLFYLLKPLYYGLGSLGLAGLLKTLTEGLCCEKGYTP